MAEKGYTGLSEFSGRIQDDFLKELRGAEAYKRYDEMRRNSPVIGAQLTAIEQSVRKIKWTFASDIENDERVEFLERARANLSYSWNDFIIEALTFLPFGFSIFEIVYERVGGELLWRKFAPRGQDTIYQWGEPFAPTGFSGIKQLGAPQYKVVEIPIESLVVFRARVERNNPEGRSILRAAWIPYYYAKHIQQIEAITIERDGAGLPKIILPQGADTSDTANSDLAKAEKMVRNIRNDEQAGIVLPPGWEFELVSSGGGKQIDMDAVVNRYETRMLMASLSQFIMLGQEGVGSLALSKDQTDFFTMSVNAVADIISDTLNQTAIPRILRLNGYDPEGVKLEHTPAGDTDTEALTTMIQKIGSYLHWSPKDEVWLRQTIGLPERTEEEIMADIESEKVEQQEERDAALARLDNPAQMNVTRFAADPPDKRERRRLEKQYEDAVQRIFTKHKKKILKSLK